MADREEERKCLVCRAGTLEQVPSTGVAGHVDYEITLDHVERIPRKFKNKINMVQLISSYKSNT